MGTQAPWGESPAQATGWSLATIMVYVVAKRIYRRWPQWWLMPLVIAPALLVVAALALHESYRDYIYATGWLVALLGPTTVAFAVPIYEQRTLIRRYWPLLLVDTVVGNLTAVVSSWALASLLGVDGPMRLSLLPRSIRTPFAVEVSGEIGGIPDLTAVFVVLTGVIGAVLGDFVLARLPLRSALAKGALFGVGAHGAGTARAHQIGRDEGAVAGLVMVLVGLINVALAPLIVHIMK